MKLNLKSINPSKIIDVIQDVECNFNNLTSEEKKQKAVALINVFVDIPLIPESVEAELIGLIVDVIVNVFNRNSWKKATHK